MSYFIDNRIHDKYIIDGVFSEIESPYMRDVIEIFNNENFNLDLSNIVFKCSDISIDNQQFTKVRIDWGDGSKDLLSKPLTSKASTISTYDPISWKQIQHLYNVDKRYEYQEGISAQSLPKIEITLYNTFNDRVVIYIPYKMVYKSIYDIGSRFSLMQANLTNRNLVSYVLKQHKDDTMLIISSGDWERFHGQIVQKVYDVKNISSSDYSNEFVNEDSIVWNWKSAPQIELTLNYVQDESYYQGKFEERTINVQEWTPRCEKLGYVNQQIQMQILDEKNKVFRCGDDLRNGVYKIWIDMVGINEIQGKSAQFYKVIPQQNYTIPARLQSFHSFIIFDDIKNSLNDTQSFIINTQSFRVSYKLDDGTFVVSPNMITNAKVILKLQEISKKHTTGGTGWQKVEQNIEFQFDLPFSSTPLKKYKGIDNKYQQSSDQYKINLTSHKFFNTFNNVMKVDEYIEIEDVISIEEVVQSSIELKIIKFAQGCIIFCDQEFRNNNVRFYGVVFEPYEYKGGLDDYYQEIKTQVFFEKNYINGQHYIEQYEKVIIDTSAIPDGIYTTSVLVEDVLGNTQNKVYIGNSPIQMPIFTIDYSIADVKNVQIDYSKYDQVTVKWNVDASSQTDEMSIKLNDIVNLRQNFENFQGEEKGQYEYTIPSYLLKDGELNVQIDNIVPMTMFGGDRRTTAKLAQPFSYTQPDISFSKVSPHIVIENGKQVVKCDIEIEESNDRRLNDIAIMTIAVDEEDKEIERQLVKMQGMKWSGNIDLITNKSIYVTGYDTEDKIYKRKSKKSSDNSRKISDLKYTYKDDRYSMFNRSLTDQVATDYGLIYKQKSTDKQLNLKQTKLISLVDVNKNLILIEKEAEKEKNRYYFSVDKDKWKKLKDQQLLPHYVINDEKKFVCFGLDKFTTKKDNYWRFVGANFPLTATKFPLSPTKFESHWLKSATDYIRKNRKDDEKIYKTSYNPDSDSMKITFTVPTFYDPYNENSDYVDGGIMKSNIYIMNPDLSEVVANKQYNNQAKPKITDEGKLEKEEVDIEIEVPLGEYKAVIENINLFIDSSQELYQIKDIITYDLTAKDCISNFNYEKIPLSTTTSNKLNVSWTTHHKNLTSQRLFISQGYGQTEKQTNDVIYNEVSCPSWKFDGKIYFIYEEKIYKQVSETQTEQYTGDILFIDDKGQKISSRSTIYEYNVLGLDYYIPLDRFDESATINMWMQLQSPYLTSTENIIEYSVSQSQSN